MTTATSPAVGKLRARIATLSTDMLLTVIRDAEARMDEDRRIVYAIAAAHLAERLGLEAFALAEAVKMGVPASAILAEASKAEGVAA